MNRLPAHLLASAALSIGAVAIAAPASAQEDFRASDPGRPLRVEDAIPLKLREWEVEFGFRGAARERESGVLGVVELKAGLFRDAHVGIEIEGGAEADGSGGTSGGIEAVHGHLLYQLGRETPSLPAFAIRIDAGTPGLGSIGRDDFSTGVEGIATRSFGRLRLHGNGGYGVMSAADGDDFWTFGLGLDYPVGLFSRAILGAVSAEIPVSEGRSRVWLEIGSRWQISNWSVFDLGLSTRLDQWNDGNANVELVFGLSRIFGISALTRVQPYPNPTIR